jgi:sugar O-acyltransferase (sialic acid O-acetyltransferase NeuD family)
MPRKAVVFGTGGFAEVVDFYLTRDSDYEVVAFTATAEAVQSATFRERPLIAFDDIGRRHPPEDHAMFVAVGYARLNALREQFCNEARALGYTLLSYVCSKATTWGDTRIGDNVFIFEHNTLQPFVTIGNGSILWSGNHIGHHSTIGEYCFITSHVVISGYCKVGDRSFLGVNSTIADDTTIAEDNIVGPGSLIQKNTAPRDVYVAERTKKFPKDSTRFFR